MIEFRKAIRKAFENFYKLEYHINERKLAKENMDKKLFIECIDTLKSIEDRRDFMEEEIGVDMTQYEDKFMQVIENLFNIAFNIEQVALIQMYLYQLVPDNEWDGTITVTTDGVEEQVPFKTPEDVWEIISKVSDKSVG